MKIKNFIIGFTTKAQNTITNLEKFKEITGAQRKERLDSFLTDWAEQNLEALGLNIVLKWALKKLLINNIPLITQIIFNLIKTNIEGITEKTGVKE